MIALVIGLSNNRKRSHSGESLRLDYVDGCLVIQK